MDWLNGTDRAGRIWDQGLQVVSHRSLPLPYLAQMFTSAVFSPRLEEFPEHRVSPNGTDQTGQLSDRVLPATVSLRSLPLPCREQMFTWVAISRQRAELQQAISPDGTAQAGPLSGPE